MNDEFFGKRDKGVNERENILASDGHNVHNPDVTVHTSLMFHKDWETSKQEEYVYKFHHQRLPALKPNQISISGVKLTRVEDDVIIVAFLRNSLGKAVLFDIVDLLLVDGNGKLLAKRLSIFQSWVRYQHFQACHGGFYSKKGICWQNRFLMKIGRLLLNGRDSRKNTMIGGSRTIFFAGLPNQNTQK